MFGDGERMFFELPFPYRRHHKLRVNKKASEYFLNDVIKLTTDFDDDVVSNLKSTHWYCFAKEIRLDLSDSKSEFVDALASIKKLSESLATKKSTKNSILRAELYKILLIIYNAYTKDSSQVEKLRSLLECSTLLGRTTFAFSESLDFLKENFDQLDSNYQYIFIDLLAKACPPGKNNKLTKFFITNKVISSSRNVFWQFSNGASVCEPFNAKSNVIDANELLKSSRLDVMILKSGKNRIIQVLGYEKNASNLTRNYLTNAQFEVLCALAEHYESGILSGKIFKFTKQLGYDSVKNSLTELRDIVVPIYNGESLLVGGKKKPIKLNPNIKVGILIANTPISKKY